MIGHPDDKRPGPHKVISMKEWRSITERIAKLEARVGGLEFVRPAENGWVCGVCDKKFSSVSDVQSHHVKYHMVVDLDESQPYRCPHGCKPGFTSMRSLNIHMEEQHKRKGRCLACEMFGTTKDSCFCAECDKAVGEKDDR